MTSDKIDLKEIRAIAEIINPNPTEKMIFHKYITADIVIRLLDLIEQKENILKEVFGVIDGYIKKNEDLNEDN